MTLGDLEQSARTNIKVVIKTFEFLLVLAAIYYAYLKTTNPVFGLALAFIAAQFLVGFVIPNLVRAFKGPHRGQAVYELLGIAFGVWVLVVLVMDLANIQ